MNEISVRKKKRVLWRDTRANLRTVPDPATGRAPWDSRVT